MWALMRWDIPLRQDPRERSASPRHIEPRSGPAR